MKYIVAKKNIAQQRSQNKLRGQAKLTHRVRLTITQCLTELINNTKYAETAIKA